MQVEIQSWSKWSDDNFKVFHQYSLDQNNLDKGMLPENGAQYKVFFKEDSSFSSEHYWKAFLVKGAGGTIMGRALVVVPKKEETSAFFGYLIAENSEVAQSLFKEAEKYTVELSNEGVVVSSLRGPINANFFNSYRMKEESEQAIFYNEPAYPMGYHRYFQEAQYIVSQRWSTIEVFENDIKNHFLLPPVQLEKIWKKSGVQIRTLDQKNWNRDFKVIFELINASFRTMKNYTPIDFPTFAKLFEDMKYIVQKELVLFAEKDGKPLAFMIGMLDPLKVLQKYNKSRRYFWNRWKLLYDLKKNQNQLLVLYTGKVERSDAKWSVAMLGHMITKNAMKLGAKSALICYVDENSPTKISLPKGITPKSRYVLYEKKLR